MENVLSIAPASYAELPEVASIHVTSWRETYVGQVPQSYLDSLDIEERLAKWRQEFGRAEYRELLLARVNGTAAGFISFGLARDDDRRSDAEIYAVYLLRQHWRAGIGYRLYKAACSILYDKGFRRAYLWVLESDLRTIAAYERWGGVLEAGRVKGHVICGQPVKEISVLFDLAEPVHERV